MTDGAPAAASAELRGEQHHVDRAYARLEVLRDRARERAAQVWTQGRGGTHAARHERDALVRSSLHRLEQLDDAEYGLVFGRLDDVEGDTWRIGRMGVTDADYEPLVVDWRAPVATPFYRATPREPLGLRRRRHVQMRGRVVERIDDELLDVAARGDDDLVLVGEGALLAAVEQPRGERMADIVATIQREQDEVIRAPLPGVTVVQGGPGTGKTAVALHRVAYLLYTNRRRIGDLGVLVIGPSARFLRYIGDVLPGLGEDAVRLSRIGDLLGDGLADGTEPDDVARLKGDARMATVIRRLVRGWSWPSHDVDWDGLPTAMLAGLLRDAPTLRRAADSVLSRAEIDRLAASGAAMDGHLPVVRTPDDVALLDEIAALVSRRRRRRRRAGGADATRIEETIDVLGIDAARRADVRALLRQQVEPDWELGEEVYGHVVVDEAQELSAMQWRMLGRRCPSGSMTVVGDLDQGTGPHAIDDWGALDEVLPGRPGVRELTINYRTPAEVMEYVATQLRRTGAQRNPPRAVRRSGRTPEVRRVPADAVADAAMTAVDDHRSEPGTLAVIAADRSIVEAITTNGDDDVAALFPTQAKGLEFDVVVVVDPAAVAATDGGAALYVALSRATRHMVIIEAAGPTG